MQNETPPGPPSLAELSGKELMKQMMQADKEDADKLFTSLEPRIQVLLLRTMLTELSQLRAARKKLEERYKVGDMAVYLHKLNLINNPQSSVNDPGQGFDVKGWQYNRGDLLGCNHATKLLNKDEFEAYPCLSKAEFMTFRKFRSHYDDGDWDPCFYCWLNPCQAPDSDGNLFWKFLPSHLMLHRICITFGMPPQRPNLRGKMVWIVQLTDKTGSIMLRIQDFKGTCLAWCCGFGVDNYEGLKLLNWLASPEWAPPKLSLSQTALED